MTLRISASSGVSRWSASLFAFLTLACLPPAAYWSWRFAAADVAALPGTPEALTSAAKLAPGEAPLWLYLAQSDPDVSGPALTAALRQDPYYSPAAIQLALWQELHGQIREAEASLLAARQKDRTYELIWALTNFYFRQNRDAEFWQYAKLAAEFQYSRPNALLELCWQRRPDPQWLFDHIIPHESWALPAFFQFLCAQNSGSLILPVALLALDRPPIEIDTEVGAAMWLWEHGRPQEAVQLWRTLAQRQLVPVRLPPNGEVLNNSDFSQVYGHAFDWREWNLRGVTGSPTSRGLSLIAENLKDNGALLSQPVLLQPGHQYRLRWRWRADADLAGADGLHWTVPPHAGAPESTRLFSPPFAARTATQDGEQSWLFTAPASAPDQLLSLDYRRESGMRAWEGTLYLENVSLRLAEQR